MDKMVAVREISPFSFGNLVLHGCDTWEYGVFSCIIHEYFCSICAEKRTESFFLFIFFLFF